MPLKELSDQARIARRWSRRFHHLQRILWIFRFFGPFTGIILGLIVVVLLSFMQGILGISTNIIIITAIVSFFISQVLDWAFIKPLVKRLNWKWYNRCFHGIAWSGAFGEIWIGCNSSKMGTGIKNLYN